MNSKQQALIELEAVIKEFGLKPTNVGVAIVGSKSFMDLMRDPKKNIRSDTIDKINRYVLEVRGQTELDL